MTYVVCATYIKRNLTWPDFWLITIKMDPFQLSDEFFIFYLKCIQEVEHPVLTSCAVDQLILCGHQVWTGNMKLHTVMKHPDTFSSYFRILFGLQHTGSGRLQTAASHLWLAVLGENNKGRNNCLHPSRDVCLLCFRSCSVINCPLYLQDTV